MTNKDMFSPGVAARRILRLADTGSLATLNPDGSPFASLVTVATTPAGEPILLISKLAVHTQNLDRDARASLLLIAPGGESGDPLAGARLSMTGSVTPPADDPALKRRFLARHPEAKGYSGFPDFSFRRFTATGAHLVAGFGRIVDLQPGDFLIEVAGAEAMIEREEGAVGHMNEDHAEAIALYATRLLGQPDGAWRMTGADPAGADLRCGTLRARLDFPAPVRTPGDLRKVLVDLVGEARRRDAPAAPAA
jgi:putative heme iron utilization protein